MKYINELNYLSFFLLVIFTGNVAQASVATVETASGQLDTQSTNAASFNYQLDGRPDPFMPFISDKATTQNANNTDDIVDENIDLTGMRKFEPGQLTLVAVMYANNQPKAMVEDVTGKGYILTEGMPIGRRGVISRIENEQVTVIETAHTRAGRKLENTIVMRLNKEGEK